jgi:hypothetical protein
MLKAGFWSLVSEGRIDCRLKRLISSRSTFWSPSLRDCGHMVLKLPRSFYLLLEQCDKLLHTFKSAEAVVF